MKNLIILLLPLLLGWSCNKVDEAPLLQQVSIVPEAYLGPAEQADFIYSISRYICHYPSEVNEQNKWEERFDDDYRDAAQGYMLEGYYVDSLSGRHFYMVSRVGRSIYEKYVALAGTFLPQQSDALHDYEESFRTWKMLPDEHLRKSEMLFRRLIHGADLSPYQIQHSYPEMYIEFPDAETWYDKEARLWRSSREDLLRPFGE